MTIRGDTEPPKMLIQTAEGSIFKRKGTSTVKTMRLGKSKHVSDIAEKKTKKAKTKSRQARKLRRDYQTTTTTTTTEEKKILGSRLEISFKKFARQTGDLQ